MWEIFSGGKSPYPGTNPVSLMKMLEGEKEFLNHTMQHVRKTCEL